MGTSKWIIMLVVMLALTGFVLAETNDENATQGQALNVRYDHLQCKVNFTNTQIDLLNKYVGVDQTTNKNTLVADMTTLKTYLDSSNKDGFDNYTASILRVDLQKATQDLDTVKKNFKQYNATNETRTALINDLKTARQTYSQCVDDKEVKMAEVMQTHLGNQEKNWNNVIDNMGKKNMTIADLEALKAELVNRTQELQAIIESGNVSQIRDFMKQLNEDQLHYAARFEIGRLNGYKQKLGEMAGRYNMTGQLDDINAKIADAEQYAQPGHKYDQGEFNKVWQDIKGAGKDMQDTAKQINAERTKQRMEQRNATIQERQQNMPGPRFEGQRRPGRNFTGNNDNAPENVNASNVSDNTGGQ